MTAQKYIECYIERTLKITKKDGFYKKGNAHSSDKTYLYSEVKHKTRSTKSDQKNYRKRIHHRDADIWK